jgi:hypothetical protein
VPQRWDHERTQEDTGDPEKFGWQRDGSYLPSPEQITQACIAIQATWPAKELRKRGAWMFCEEVELDPIGDSKFHDC